MNLLHNYTNIEVADLFTNTFIDIQYYHDSIHYHDMLMYHCDSCKFDFLPALILIEKDLKYIKHKCI